MKFRLYCLVSFLLLVLVHCHTLLDIPARRMWGWGTGLDGYCGECSFQSTALFWGNYFSQEECRYADGNSELLIAVNDETAAKALRLTYVSWNYKGKTPQENAFKKWVKDFIDQGVPVIAGFYERLNKGGDSNYDHIMPIIGYMIDSKGEITDFYHNDFYLKDTTTTSSDFETRSQCMQASAPKQPYSYCLPTDIDYAIAITGIVDPNKETYRARLVVLNMWDEPDWGAEDKLHQKPIQFDSELHVSGLKSGNKYTCLRFDDVKSLPVNGGFLTSSYDAAFPFIATSDNHVLPVASVLSDGTYFYRCVDA